MLKTKIITLAILVAFMVAPKVVTAEITPNVSHSAKKQGRVIFTEKHQENTAADKTSNEALPAEIEPAAGGGYNSNKQQNQDDALANSMKLPRKN